ncbi:MAG: hypothetical protein HY696_08925 [Deltaproteobacteria bacterium]|nr:hypothetical protein [Deltaproteobacteria bacterium]
MAPPGPVTFTSLPQQSAYRPAEDTERRRPAAAAEGADPVTDYFVETSLTRAEELGVSGATVAGGVRLEARNAATGEGGAVGVMLRGGETWDIGLQLHWSGVSFGVGLDGGVSLGMGPLQWSPGRGAAVGAWGVNGGGMQLAPGWLLALAASVQLVATAVGGEAHSVEEIIAVPMATLLSSIVPIESITETVSLVRGVAGDTDDAGAIASAADAARLLAGVTSHLRRGQYHTALLRVEGALRVTLPPALRAQLMGLRDQALVQVRATMAPLVGGRSRAEASVTNPVARLREHLVAALDRVEEFHHRYAVWLAGDVETQDRPAGAALHQYLADALYLVGKFELHTDTVRRDGRVEHTVRASAPFAVADAAMAARFFTLTTAVVKSVTARDSAALRMYGEQARFAAGHVVRGVQDGATPTHALGADQLLLDDLLQWCAAWDRASPFADLRRRHLRWVIAMRSSGMERERLLRDAIPAAPADARPPQPERSLQQAIGPNLVRYLRARRFIQGLLALEWWRRGESIDGALAPLDFVGKARTTRSTRDGFALLYDVVSVMSQLEARQWDHDPVTERLYRGLHRRLRATLYGLVKERGVELDSVEQLEAWQLKLLQQAEVVGDKGATLLKRLSAVARQLATSPFGAEFAAVRHPVAALSREAQRLLPAAEALSLRRGANLREVLATEAAETALIRRFTIGLRDQLATEALPQLEPLRAAVAITAAPNGTPPKDFRDWQEATTDALQELQEAMVDLQDACTQAATAYATFARRRAAKQMHAHITDRALGNFGLHSP